MASEEKLLKAPVALCNIISRIALAAGEIVMEYYEGLEEHHIDVKSDDSPVTKADREAEKFIKKELHALLPSVPFVGEETVAGGCAPDVSSVSHFWLVDPLDGTKEFIRGGEDFTVNIGLVHEGKSVLGVVYAPVREELYAGYIDGDQMRAFKRDTDTGKERDIMVREPQNAGLIAFASRVHGDPSQLEEFLSSFKVSKILKRGSSLKICEIAAGKADIYPRFGPTCEWDTAAAHAVLKAAGGYLTDMDGAELTYGGAMGPQFYNPYFVASAFDWSAQEED